MNVNEIVSGIEKAGLSVVVRPPARARSLLGIESRWGAQRFVINSHMLTSPEEPLGVRLCDVNDARQMVLMDVVTEGILGSERLLLGQDERYFITGAPKGSTTVSDALARMVPPEVRAARKQGRSVKRQGDWFFVPLLPDETPSILFDWWAHADAASWLLDHRAEQCARLQDQTFVRGEITHPEHRPLRLDEWHFAIANLAIRVPQSRTDWIVEARMRD